jgi:hypothetical protein
LLANIANGVLCRQHRVETFSRQAVNTLASAVRIIGRVVLAVAKFAYRTLAAFTGACVKTGQGFQFFAVTAPLVAVFDVAVFAGGVGSVELAAGYLTFVTLMALSNRLRPAVALFTGAVQTVASCGISVERRGWQDFATLCTFFLHNGGMVPSS